MQLGHKRVIGLPVRTVAGQPLGKVADFLIETDTGKLDTIMVRPAGLLHGFIESDLVIRWPHIVSMSEEEVVVRDAVVPEAAASIALGIVPPVIPPQAPSL